MATTSASSSDSPSKEKEVVEDLDSGGEERLAAALPEKRTRKERHKHTPSREKEQSKVAVKESSNNRPGKQREQPPLNEDEEKEKKKNRSIDIFGTRGRRKASYREERIIKDKQAKRAQWLKDLSQGNNSEDEEGVSNNNSNNKQTDGKNSPSIRSRVLGLSKIWKGRKRGKEIELRKEGSVPAFVTLNKTRGSSMSQSCPSLLDFVESPTVRYYHPFYFHVV